MKTLLALSAITIFAFCGVPARAGTVSRPIRLGQTVRIGGPQVRPLKIIEDSRCPMNARCVWAGRAVVQAQVSGGAWSRIVNLTLGKAEHVADGEITLISVTPDRVAGQRLKPGRMRFTFAYDGSL